LMAPPSDASTSSLLRIVQASIAGFPESADAVSVFAGATGVFISNAAVGAAVGACPPHPVNVRISMHVINAKDCLDMDLASLNSVLPPA
jgi:hypothetical protein